ncbi:hypothetical protein KA001_00380 [Patescibacteria group bacterium]|nr:hypothetical protein [Patescibacteria group bacterium]
MFSKLLFFSTAIIAFLAVIFLYMKAVNFDRIYPQPLSNIENKKLTD